MSSADAGLPTAGTALSQVNDETSVPSAALATDSGGTDSVVSFKLPLLSPPLPLPSPSPWVSGLALAALVVGWVDAVDAVDGYEFAVVAAPLRVAVDVVANEPFVLTRLELGLVE